MKVLCEEMSKMMLISKKFCIDVTPTAICTDFKKFGKCYIKELRNLLHPRLAFFKLNRKLDENNNNEQDESIDANIVPAPILNRFKNSTFFSAKDSIEAESERYYSRNITRDPNSKDKHTYVHSFGDKNMSTKKSLPVPVAESLPDDTKSSTSGNIDDTPRGRRLRRRNRIDYQT